MNFKKFRVFLIAFITFFVFTSDFFCENLQSTKKTGTNLCNYVLKTLENHKFKTQTQNLLLNGNNDFPYNIIVEFNFENLRKKNNYENSDENFKTNSRRNLIFTIRCEDFEKHEKTIIEFLKYLDELYKNENSFCDFTILFSYGEDLSNSLSNVHGILVFTDELEKNKDFSAINIRFDCKKNSVIAGNLGMTAPTFLVKNAFRSFSESKLSDALPFFYSSSMFRSRLNSNPSLSVFFENEIPAIIFEFSIKNSDEQILTCLKKTAEFFSNSEEKISDDSHSFMLNIFGKQFWLGETLILYIIVIIIFIAVSFLFILSFIRMSLKRKSWTEIDEIIFIIPLFLLGIFLSFNISRLFFEKFYFDKGIFMCGISLCLCLIFVSIFSIFINKYKKVHLSSVDFICSMIFFADLFIFSIIDISLFPVFLIPAVISIFPLFIKKLPRFIIFLAEIFPFATYTAMILELSNPSLLNRFLMFENSFLITVMLVLLPFFIVLFRIFSEIYRKNEMKKFILIVLSVNLIFCPFILNLTYKIHKNEEFKLSGKNNVTIFKRGENSIEISYEDKIVLGNTVRTLNIQTEKNPSSVSVILNGQNENPVLYSENSFTLLNNFRTSFNIPPYPPENLTFTYGPSDEECLITVTARYETKDSDVFRIDRSQLKTGEKK